jgi:glycine C-acetyltransferase
MTSDTLAEKQSFARIRNLASGSKLLKKITERYDLYVENGNAEMIERVFHSTPKKNATVSINAHARNTSNVDSLFNTRTEVLHLGSYNYAGLNGHPDIIAAAIDATQRYGTTTSGVRLLNGTSEMHLALEKRLAEFLGVEEVITYSSGFMANLAAFGSICQKGDLILSDKLNHQSIADGIKLSGCECITYRPGNADSIQRALRDQPIERRKFIVTDGVFSMDGNLAPLPEIVRLAEKYNAYIIVDDAHGTASIGPNGRGTCAHFGLTDKVDIITGSLSKGLPGIGGFIATSRNTAKIIRSASNPYIFSASLPPATAASIIAAIDILEANPAINIQLMANAHYFQSHLRAAGFNLSSTESAIIPILMPSVDITYDITRKLQQNGIYVNPVVYPAVSLSRSRIRLNVSADLTEEELRYSVSTICKCARELSVID